MDFKQAFEAIKQGAKIKLPTWGGYWYWDSEKRTIVMFTKDGDKIDIRDTYCVEYTLRNILSDEWELADSSNCPMLGGTAKITFGDAIRYLKKGLKVARRDWNVKGMYVFLHEGYDTNENKHITGDAHACMNPYFCIKNVNGSISTWVPNVNDCLADDWRVVE